MVAVLPLAALATFETVPGVPLAVARALAVRAVGRAPLRPRGRAGPGTRPGAPDRSAAGRARGGLRGRRPALRRRRCPAPSTASACASPGGRLAVTGSSGAGKSSLVTALLRYWPLEAGTLSLGGTDVERLAQADARGACALADQRAQLFAGTVRVQPDPGPARRHRGRDRRRAARGPRSTSGWPRCPRGSRRRSARTGSRSRAASAGAWPWPGPCWPPGRSWSSTSRPAGSTRAWPTSSSTACWPPPGSAASWSITHRAGEGADVRRHRHPRGGARRGRARY